VWGRYILCMAPLQHPPRFFSITDALSGGAPCVCTGLFVQLAVVAGVREVRGRAKVSHNPARLLRRLLVGETRGRGGRALGVAKQVAKALESARRGPHWRPDMSLEWCAAFAAHLGELNERWRRVGGDWDGFLGRHHRAFADDYVRGLVTTWRSALRVSALRPLAPYLLWRATRNAPPGKASSSRHQIVTRMTAFGRRPDERTRKALGEIRSRVRATHPQHALAIEHPDVARQRHATTHAILCLLSDPELPLSTVRVLAEEIATRMSALQVAPTVSEGELNALHEAVDGGSVGTAAFWNRRVLPDVRPTAD